MATTYTGKTYDDYWKEALNRGTADLYDRAAKRKESDAETLAGYNEAIDQSAEQASGVYQKRIDSSDAQYKTRYADNAVQEAFNRQQIKEAMANSGMTDSGYNRTMQTALTLNRSRQDAAVTADKQSYVQKLQDAIDSVMTQAETEKKSKALAMEQDYKNWWDNAYASMNQNAVAEAGTNYNADVEQYNEQQRLLAEQQEKARQQEEDRILAGIEAGVIDPTEGYAYLSGLTDSYTIRETGSSDLADLNKKMILQKVENGEMSIEEAQIALYGTDEQKKSWGETVSSNAKSFADGLAGLDVTSFLSGTWLKNQNSDWKTAANKVKDTLANNQTYQKMTATEKEQALAYTIAKCVGNSWDTKAHGDNEVRLKNISAELGANYTLVKKVYDEYYSYDTSTMNTMNTTKRPIAARAARPGPG